MSSKASVNPFFTPTQISGCQLWLDAADTSVLSLSGSTTVTAWRDKASNISFTGVNNPQTGTARINGLNVMDVFTNANSFFSNASFSFSTPYSIFGVGITKTTVNNDAIAFLGGITDQYLAIQLQNTSPQQLNTWPRGPSGWAYNSAYASNLINTNILVGMTVAAGSVLPTPYLNGSSLSLFESANSATTTITGLQIGNRASIIPWKGYIGEVLIYNQVLSTAQRQQLEGYLAWKWGLQASLPATHPYKNSPIPPLLSPPVTLPIAKQNSFFLPTQISGCQLWLDGADPNGNGILPSNGSTVSTWVDKSGAGNNATGAVSPTYSNNNIIFDGTQYFTTNYTAVPSAETIFVVAIITGTTDTKNFFMVAPTNNNERGYTVNLTSGVYTVNWDKAGIARYASTSGIQQNVRFLSTGLYTGTSGTTNLNGGNQSASASFSFSGSGQTKIGAVVAGISNTSWVGSMNEIIIFNYVLSVSQYQQIEGYLAWKWGLQGSLPAGHPYKTSIIPPLLSPPTTRPTISSVSWQPNQISGLSLWLDGADPAGTGVVPTNGSSISSWVDKSGNGNTLTATGSPLPTYISSSRTISYDGSSYFQKASLSFTAYTLFIIANKTSGNGPLYTNTTTTPYSGFFPNLAGNYYLIRNNTTGNEWGTATSPFSDGTTYLYSIQYASNSNVNVWSNGGVPAAITTTQTGTITQDSLLLGKRNSGSFTENWIGTFSEVIQYNTAISTAQRQNVEGYLAWKWGLQGSLPSTHPYAKWPPSP